MSKRHDPGPPSEDGIAALAAEGINASSLGDGSVSTERLGAILAAHTDASLALAHLLGSIPRQEHADLLAVADPATHGALRREVRRALYRLRQSGIEPAARPPGPAAPSAALAGDEPQAWCSHIDGRGDQLVWITKSGLGGFLFVSARVNDGEGMCEISAVEISKRQFRHQRDQLAERHHLRMVPIPWRHADAMLVAAQGRGSRKGHPSYLALRTQLTSESPIPVSPLVYEHISPATIEDSLVAVSEELLKEPELRSWLPPPSSIEPYVREIMSARESPLVLSQPQQEDRLANIFERATSELYPSALWASRFETMAFYLDATDRERAARIALAVSQALAGGAPAQSIPVLRALAREALSAVYEVAQARAKEQERDSILVKPGAPASGPTPRR